jgi:hypothetical protein
LRGQGRRGGCQQDQCPDHIILLLVSETHNRTAPVAMEIRA